jgi:hypothetical protein
MANQSETISIDEKFLKDLVARGGKATDIASGQQITNQVEADQFLQQHVSGQKTEKLSDDEARVRQLNRRSERLVYTPEQREQRRQEREAQQRRQARQQGIRATEIAMHSVSSGTQRLIDKVAAAPVPGGIGLLVAVIILLLFVVVQVNAEGDTRLKLLWYMLNGRASLIGSKSIEPPTNSTGSTRNSTPPATPGAPLSPTDASGNCPPGFHVVIVSGGKRMCQADGSGPDTPPMALFPINSTYRTITGDLGF